ncbi:MAG: LacI family DNA-binding transcriptional regulator [Thermaerobacter sp.]|nr:LacI family DNA-binding transcriptional regulator [Thermaerobacter sp.]
MATVRDVAEAAKVSVSTVSLAFNQPSRVAEATRLRILAVAGELQYRPHGIARDLRIRHTNTIAVLLHNLSGPFYSELIRGVEDEADRSGLTTIVSRATPNRPGGTIRLLHEGRVDGAIVLDPLISADSLRQYAGPRLPIVVLDRTISVASDYVIPVVADHEGGGYQAGRFLITLGYQHYALITGPADSTDSQLRQKGFFRALREANLQWQQVPVISGLFTEDGGAEATARLLDTGYRPDAIFAANDEMAIGAMQTLARYGLAVPDEVALIGFDDIRLARYVSPPLTTIHQPMYDLGRAAMQRLSDTMQGKLGLPPVVLSTHLVIRGSTAASPTKAGEVPYAGS